MCLIELIHIFVLRKILFIQFRQQSGGFLFHMKYNFEVCFWCNVAGDSHFIYIQQ